MNLLRFLTCGSVDDGKSTLIGRLLFDGGMVLEDHLADLGTSASGGPDLSLLMDGLAAEREQGITIDVAYRHFQTPRRRFIVADTPGHEQYTRNMVTGASTAELALLLVDVRKGLLRQTRRHLHLTSLLGIRKCVLAVNKMDLVGYDPEPFSAIEASFRALAARLGLDDPQVIPVSAVEGANIARRSERTLWYQGPTLLEHLETVPLDEPAQGPFRMPVQRVTRHHDFRGFAGTVAEGSIAPGDKVLVQPAGRTSTVARIVKMGGDAEAAAAPEAITLTLTDDVDCGRGDVIASAEAPLMLADHFEATLVWMDEEPLLPGRAYLMKVGTATVGAAVTDLKHELDVEAGEQIPAKTLAMNGIASVNVALDRRIPFAPYAESRTLGGFVLIDRATNATAGAGMIHFALRRSENVRWQHLAVDRAAHAALKAQQPKVVWFTGLSGAGKSTIANLVEKKLHALGRHTFLLDGDNLRHGLNRDLGFTDADRVENIRRAGEVAKLMADAGLIVLCAFISPFRAERQMVRELLPHGEFLEVFVEVPLEEAERRDPKGLYRRARVGEIPNFTGINSPYEAPEAAELHIDTTLVTAAEAADQVVDLLLI